MKATVGRAEPSHVVPGADPSGRHVECNGPVAKAEAKIEASSKMIL